MKTIVIKTQKEWHELPSEFKEVTEIEIKTDGSFWLEIKSTPKNGNVYANGTSKVYAYDSSTVYANDSSTVSANGSSTVYAYDSSTVYANDSSTVYAYDSSTVYANGSSTITAYLVCCIFIYSNLVKIKHLADQTTAKFFNGVDYKKVILKKDKTAQVVAKVKEPSFETWLERGIVKADGITRRFVSKKKIGAIESFEVQDDFGVKSFLVKKGNTFSHGKTIKEAKDSLKYKISSRDVTPFKKWNLSTVVTQSKMIEAYRVITGACEYGVRGFMEGKKVPAKLSVKKAIELTSGAYGSEQFKGFFK